MVIKMCEKKLTPTLVRLQPDQIMKLQKIKKDKGIPIAEQIRRAIEIFINNFFKEDTEK
jgi:hypothetical protein